MERLIKPGAQGDVLLIPTDQPIPDNAEVVKSENGKNIITHSESGHHHTTPDDVTTLFKSSHDFEAMLKVDEDTQITHERSFDTHKPIGLPAGNYIVKRQREYTPEGFRRAQD